MLSEFYRGSPLTEAEIARVKSLTLAVEYPDFVRSDGFLAPDFHEDMERFKGMFGESNVVSSFFIDGEGVVAFGIFVDSAERDKYLATQQSRSETQQA
jgi:hypothetical protein